MAQRHSEYERVPNDLYVTPKWVWEALYSVEPWARQAWDCCPPKPEKDFFDFDFTVRDIATNPPYSNPLCGKVIRHALAITASSGGMVAMLLPITWDTRKSRYDLFGWCQAFKAKYILTERIRWSNLEQKENDPSAHHAWHVWDHQHKGQPFIGWLPLLDNEEAA